ncbi:MAG TPA: hypothetical protein VEG08_01700 [Terriglobales bacterium]|nr:hypothetical protein [Terriglobales bacterium]
MQKAAWKLLLSFFLLITLVLLVGVAQAQENAATAQPQAAAAPYHPAAAAFATPLPKPASPAVTEGPDPSRKWEIEVHGGGAFANSPHDGTGTLPGAGATFTAVNATTSRAIPSYYFGDGTLLYNQAVDAAAFPGITTHIMPLDPILTTRTAERDNGGAFGFRLSRDIARRWAIEANFDYSLANLRVNSTGLAGIEASRATWATAWTENLTGFSPVVTSVSAIDRSEGQQIFGTVGVNLNLVSEGRVVPYLSFGGGALASVGDLPSATLVGNFQVTIRGGPHNNTDAVLINWSTPDLQAVGYFGGGIKYYVTPRWGFRIDARDYLSGNGLEQFVSASPAVLTLTPAQTIDFSGVSPNIQLSNNPPGGPDTLSGPALTRFRTFSGEGIRNQAVVSGGIFFRF